MGYPAFAIVACTFSDEDEARKIAHHLVENRLAACINILPPITSVYRWKDKIHEEGEVLALVKTSWEQRKHTMDAIRKLHSYDVPGIEIWPVEDAPESFRRWVIHESAKI